MSPGQARVTVLAFLILSGAIVLNAVFLQRGRHPALLRAMQAPELAAVSPSKSPFRPARPLSPRATPAVAVSPSPEATTWRRIRALQKSLSARGYSPGQQDGQLRAMTRAAIMAYEADNGLPVTAVPSTALLRHLRGEMRVTPPPPTPVQVGSLKKLVAAVQRVLADQAYLTGSIDGTQGEGTRQAIGAFEKDRGLTVTGRISGRLLQEIARVTGVRILPGE